MADTKLDAKLRRLVQSIRRISVSIRVVVGLPIQITLPLLIADNPVIFSYVKYFRILKLYIYIWNQHGK